MNSALGSAGGIPSNHKWARIFGFVALFHLAVAAVWTGLTAIPDLNIPRIIAGGSAGMWYTTAYLMYVIAGAAGMTMFATMYYIAGGNVNNVVGWLHLLISNVGIAGAAYVLGYAGYNAGYMQHVLNTPTEEIHNFLAPFVEPLGLLALIAALGVLVGVVSLALAFRRES